MLRYVTLLTYLLHTIAMGIVSCVSEIIMMSYRQYGVVFAYPSQARL